MTKAERWCEKTTVSRRKALRATEVLRKIFLPRALSSDILFQPEMGFFFFMTLRLISQGERTSIKKEKKSDIVMCMAGLRLS